MNGMRATRGTASCCPARSAQATDARQARPALRPPYGEPPPAGLAPAIALRRHTVEAGPSPRQAAAQRAGWLAASPSTVRARPSAASVSRITGSRSRQRPRAWKRASRSASASGVGLVASSSTTALICSGRPAGALDHRRRGAAASVAAVSVVLGRPSSPACAPALRLELRPQRTVPAASSAALRVQRHQPFEQRLHRRARASAAAGRWSASAGWVGQP